MEEFEESLNSSLKVNILFYFLRIIFIYSILLSIDVIVEQYIANIINKSQILTLTMSTQILWVVLNITLVVLLLKNILFVWIEQKKGKPIPNLIKELMYGFIYVLGFIFIYKYVLLLDLVSLLASMGVLAMVVGFALQSNISNIFSGIALNLEKTIEIDDWVKFGSYDEGQVKDISWRTTTILCRDGRIIHIPNSVIADHPLINYSKSKQLLQLLIVDVNLKHKPEEVKPILLQAMKNVSHIVDVPIPEVGVKEIDQWSAKYKVLYYIDIYSQRFNVAQNIWSNIWSKLAEAGIKPSIPKNELFIQLDNNQETNQEKSVDN